MEDLSSAGYARTPCMHRPVHASNEHSSDNKQLTKDHNHAIKRARKERGTKGCGYEGDLRPQGEEELMADTKEWISNRKYYVFLYIILCGMAVAP